MPGFELIDDESAPRKDKRPVKWSNYFFTVNTNKESTPELYQSLGRALRLFSDTAPSFVQFLPGGKESDRKIVDWTGHMVREVGPKFKRLHSHMAVSFIHRARVKVDLKKMREFFADALGLDSVYLNYRGLWHVKPENLRIENYLRKGFKE